MALVDVTFYSNALNRQVAYKALIPIDGPMALGAERDNTPLRTLYLLHGIMGSSGDWLACSRVANWAGAQRIALVFPAGDNSFYVDQEASNSYYGDYIGRELVEETRRMFPLSHKREDTFIGGLSMGGYGALRNGLKYHETFGGIIALSSALIQETAIASTEQSEWSFGKRSYYESVFGDLTKLAGSDKDIAALVQGIQAQGAVYPRIYIACGTEDFLIENNRRCHAMLQEAQVEHEYLESPGVHDWAFWDDYIQKALAWM